jgi:predicted HAD superfamily Cof-like phosphohydrolase
MEMLASKSSLSAGGKGNHGQEETPGGFEEVPIQEGEQEGQGSEREEEMTHEDLIRQRSRHQRRVDAFMIEVSDIRIRNGLNIDDGQAVPDKPVMISESGRRLRANLILEEALETIRGLGFNVISTGPHANQIGIELSNDEPDLVEIVDGCLDLRVVTTGTLSAFGVPDVYGQELVDLNNLGKLGPGCEMRTDGKLIKPKDHKPPPIREWLKELG